MPNNSAYGAYNAVELVMFRLQANNATATVMTHRVMTKAIPGQLMQLRLF